MIDTLNRAIEVYRQFARTLHLREQREDLSDPSGQGKQECQGLDIKYKPLNTNKKMSFVSNSSLDNTFTQAKGLAILLVVFGHIASPLGLAIFSFHIPLFFFLGGVFIKNRICSH